jgi:hypothetical protein
VWLFVLVHTLLSTWPRGDEAHPRIEPVAPPDRGGADPRRYRRITDLTVGRSTSQANATCALDAPRSGGIPRTASTTAQVRSERLRRS